MSNSPDNNSKELVSLNNITQSSHDVKISSSDKENETAKPNRKKVKKKKKSSKRKKPKRSGSSSKRSSVRS